MTTTSSTGLSIVNASLPRLADDRPRPMDASGRSPFAGTWIRYCLPPIDWNWELLVSIGSLLRRDAERPAEPSSGPCMAFHLGAFLQVVMNHGLAVASDYREEPRVIALPGSNEMEIHGFVWKVDTNGQTFVVLRQESQALIGLILKDIKSLEGEPILFSCRGE